MSSTSIPGSYLNFISRLVDGAHGFKFRSLSAQYHDRNMLASKSRACTRCVSRFTTTTRLNAAPFSTLPETASEAPAQSAAQTNQSRGRFSRTASGKPHVSTRKGPPRAASKESQAAVDIFNDVVKAPDSEDTVLTASFSPEDWKVASKLRAMSAKKEKPVEERIRMFKEEIGPYLDTTPRPIPQQNYVFATDVLGKIAGHALQDGALGHAVQLSKLHAKLSGTPYELDNAMVMRLCYILASTEVTAETEVAKKELIELWKHLSQVDRPSQVDQAAAFTFPVDSDQLAYLAKVPRTTTVDTKTNDPLTKNQMRNSLTTRAIKSMFLQTQFRDVPKLIPGLLATAVVLQTSPHIDTETRQQAEPLLHKISVVLQYFEITDRYVELVLSKLQIRGVPADLIDSVKEYTVGHWRKTKSSIRKEFAAKNEKSANLQAALLTKKMHKQLRALKFKRDKVGINSLWQAFKESLVSNTAMADHLRADHELLDFWLFVWCSSRQPDRAHEATNLMRKLGVEPTVKSYTAMMYGWRTINDVARIEGLWQLLIKNNVPLDQAIWTERMAAYIHAGRVQAGVAALGEMHRTWQDAEARGHPEQAVQVNIAVVNAVLKGLLLVDRKAADTTLRWAGQIGISPDVITYNMLIRQSFRDGNPEAVESILRNMQKEGVNPDAATFTVILEEVLGNMHHATADEQVAAVDRVIAEIEEAGLQANLETYGKMLHAVATLPHGGADKALERVQTHMQAKGLKISHQMVTILVSRLLTSGAFPNIEAMESLLEKNGIHDIKHGDQTLWERVMVAYATVGDTKAAMTIYTELQDSGRMVTSLPDLWTLLNALLNNKQIEEAQALVNSVVQHKMSLGPDKANPRYYRHKFWYMAELNGLLEMELPAALREALQGRKIE